LVRKPVTCKPQQSLESIGAWHLEGAGQLKGGQERDWQGETGVSGEEKQKMHTEMDMLPGEAENQ